MNNPPDDSAQFLGRLLGERYLLLRVLGRGGMGAVYEAVNQVTQRRVAVKLLHADAAQSADAAARFLREAQAPSTIRHPHIVDVLDAGKDVDGTLYIVMELLDGEDLAAVLERARLPVPTLMVLMFQVLDALSAAHGRGYVHRDIKPQNIFLAYESDGTVKARLVDFGIARQVDGHASEALTNTGTVVGTPHFMAPEQARGERVDGRSDLWSLAATMFRALAGVPPFPGDHYNIIIASLLTRDPPKLAELCPELPQSVQTLVDRGLCPDLKLRWQSAREMARQVELIAQELGLQLQLPLQPEAFPPKPTLRDRADTDALAATVGTPSPVLPRPRNSPTAPLPQVVPPGTARLLDTASDEKPSRRPAATTRLQGRSVLLGLGMVIGAMVGTLVGVQRWSVHRRANQLAATEQGVAAPRPLEPLSGAVLSPANLTFQWELPQGAEAVILELCREQACQTVRQREYVVGAAKTLGNALEPGLWWWQLRSLSNAKVGVRSSARWSFRIAAQSPAGVQLGTVDLDGDGRAELYAGAPRAKEHIGAVLHPSTSAGGRSTLSWAGTEGSNAGFGAVLLGLGDLDGDGLGELFIGAPQAFGQQGSARVLRGAELRRQTHEGLELHGDREPGSYFGRAVAAPGDLNHDGYADLLVGQPGAHEDQGKVWVYWGGEGPRLLREGPRLMGQDAREQFGAALAAVGDVQGDGHGDLLVGSPGADREAGRVSLFFGTELGPNTRAALQLSPTAVPGGGHFGAALAALGRLDGDRYADFAVAEPDALGGRVYLYAGLENPSSLVAQRVLTAPDGTEGRFGATLLGGCDFNADGHPELVVSAPHWNARTGKVYLYRSDGRALETEAVLVLAGPDGPGSRFGEALACIGDLTGDGRPELAVGAPGAHEGRGAVYLYEGSELAVDTSGRRVLSTEDADAQLGAALASAPLVRP